MDASEAVYCLNCNWTGVYGRLINVPWTPDDDLSIAGETYTACPSCQSAAWEPDGLADNVKHVGMTSSGAVYAP